MNRSTHIFSVAFLALVSLAPFGWTNGMPRIQSSFESEIVFESLDALTNGSTETNTLVASPVPRNGNRFDLWIPESVQRAVRGQHVALQFVEMMFLVEVGYYSGHRLMHAVPFLWRFHRVHHSSREMDWMSTQRGHPVDLIISWSITLIPVMALGDSFEVLAALQLCWLVQNHLAHANVSWRLRFLSRFFVTPQVHRWHHSASPDTWNTNFAGQLLFMDWLFGTYLQRDDTPPEYGVDESRTEVGRNYPEQLVRPLMPQRWLEKLDRDDP